MGLFTLFLLVGGSLPLTERCVAYDGSESHLWLIPQGGTIYTNTTFYIYLYLNAANRTGSAIANNITFSSGNCTATYYVDATYFFGSSPFYDVPVINNASNYISGFQIGEDDYAGVGNGHTGNETMIRFTFNVSTPGSWDINISGTANVYDENGTGMGCTRHNRTITITALPSYPNAPLLFAAETHNTTQINLSWTKGSGADNTVVCGKSGTWPSNAQDSVIYNNTGTTYNHGSLSPGTTYYYRAWSWNTTESLFSLTYDGDSNATSSLGQPDPPNSLDAGAYNSTVINVTWNTGTGADSTVLCGKSGSYPANAQDSVLYNGSLTSYNHTGRSPSTTYYYRAWSWNTTNSTFSATYDSDTATTSAAPGANNPPEVSSVSPSNAQTNVVISALSPQAIFNDQDGDYLNIYFRENTTGSWTTVQSHLSVYPGTYPTGTSRGFTYSNASAYSTRYYWSINVTDGTNWTNATYYFTTQAETLVPPDAPNHPYPANGSSNVPHHVNLSCIVTDVDNDTMDVYFFNANTSEVLSSAYNQSMIGVASGSRAWMWVDIPDNTTFYWYARAWDGIQWSNDSVNWSFSTTGVTPGFYAPNKPSDPFPSHNQVNVATRIIISCYISYAEGQSPNPGMETPMSVQFYGNQSGSTRTLLSSQLIYGNQWVHYEWTGLSLGTTYIWNVSVWDYKYIVEGDIWQFTTYHSGDPDMRFFVYTFEGDTKIPLNDVNISYRPMDNTTVEGYANTDSQGKVDINVTATVATWYTFYFNPNQPYHGQYYSFLITPNVGEYEEIVIYKWGDIEQVVITVNCYDKYNPDRTISNFTVTCFGNYMPLVDPYFGDEALTTMYIIYPKPTNGMPALLQNAKFVVSKNWNHSEDADSTWYENVTVMKALVSKHYNILLSPYGYRPAGDPDSTDLLGLGEGALKPYFGPYAGMMLSIAMLVCVLVIMNTRKNMKIPIILQVFIMGIVTIFCTIIGWLPVELLILPGLGIALMIALTLKNMLGGGQQTMGNGGPV